VCCDTLLTKLQEILKLGMKEQRVILAKKSIKKFTIYILMMQVNNAGVPGGKLIDGDALLRKVGFIPFQLKIIITLFKFFLFGHGEITSE